MRLSEVRPFFEETKACRGDKCLAQPLDKMKKLLRPVLVEFAENIVEQQDRGFSAPVPEVEELRDFQCDQKCLLLSLRSITPHAETVDPEQQLVPLRTDESNAGAP